MNGEAKGDGSLGELDTTSAFHFADLPEELRKEVLAHLNASTCHCLALTCKKFYTVYFDLILFGLIFGDECARSGEFRQFEWAIGCGCPYDEDTITAAFAAPRSCMPPFAQYFSKFVELGTDRVKETELAMMRKALELVGRNGDLAMIRHMVAILSKQTRYLELSNISVGIVFTEEEAIPNLRAITETAARLRIKSDYESESSYAAQLFGAVLRADHLELIKEDFPNFGNVQAVFEVLPDDVHKEHYRLIEFVFENKQRQLMKMNPKFLNTLLRRLAERGHRRTFQLIFEAIPMTFPNLTPIELELIYVESFKEAVRAFRPDLLDYLLSLSHLPIISQGHVPLFGLITDGKPFSAWESEQDVLQVFDILEKKCPLLLKGDYYVLAKVMSADLFHLLEKKALLSLRQDRAKSISSLLYPLFSFPVKRRWDGKFESFFKYLVGELKLSTEVLPTECRAAFEAIIVSLLDCCDFKSLNLIILHMVPSDVLAAFSAVATKPLNGTAAKFNPRRLRAGEILPVMRYLVKNNMMWMAKQLRMKISPWKGGYLPMVREELTELLGEVVQSASDSKKKATTSKK